MLTNDVSTTVQNTRTMENIVLPGQYFDQETNLHYNYFRDYDPTTGRYVESDPIGLKGGLNTYEYVDGNTLTLIDPEGLWGIDIRKLAGIGISGTGGRGWWGLSGGFGIEMQMCCENNKVYNEIYWVFRGGVGVGKGMTFTASGRGNIPQVRITSATRLPQCISEDLGYWVGKPFGSGGGNAGPIAIRVSGDGASMGYAPGGKGVTAYINIIDRKWLIDRDRAGDLTCCE